MKRKQQKALFLDRDGVINIDNGYVYKIDDFEFIKGIFDLIKKFIHRGYIIFIVTNQSGIGREYYSSSDFEKLTSWMLDTFKTQGISIESVHHCPHGPKEKCLCRKPATGMVDAILAKHHIDLHSSWLIGDKQSDIDLAHNANIVNTIAIGSRVIENYDYHFATVLDCKEYIEENQGTIL